MPETGAEILARIQPKLAEDWVEVCLRPDLVTEHEELDARLEELEDEKARLERVSKVGPERMNPVADPRLAEVEAEIEETLCKIANVEEEMASSAVKFTFRALPRDKFRALCDANPPRKDDVGDLSVGYHRADVGDKLVEQSLIEPVFDETSWTALLDVISIGEWNRLRARAEKVNGSVVTENPKSLLASRIRSSRASASEQPSEQE